MGRRSSAAHHRSSGEFVPEIGQRTGSHAGVGEHPQAKADEERDENHRFGHSTGQADQEARRGERENDRTERIDAVSPQTTRQEP